MFLVHRRRIFGGLITGLLIIKSPLGVEIIRDMRILRRKFENNKSRKIFEKKFENNKSPPQANFFSGG